MDKRYAVVEVGSGAFVWINGERREGWVLQVVDRHTGENVGARVGHRNFVTQAGADGWCEHFNRFGLEPASYHVPPRFWDDHVARGCAEDGLQEEVRRTARSVQVRLDRAGYAELLSDAEHYADPSMQAELDPEYVGLVTSARATVRTLRKWGAPL